MSTKVKVYITFFILSGLSAYYVLDGSPDVVIEVIKSLRFVAIVCSTFFIGLILFVKTTLKDLGKLEKLRSSELKIINEFVDTCNNKIWLQVSFYGIVFLYGLALTVVPFESEQYRLINVAIFLGLFFVEIATLISTYNLDRSIAQFQSYIQLRAKKIAEKDAALEMLDKDNSFSERDLEHFKKRRKVTKL